MDKSFDFGALMKCHEKQHKSKPTQFASVADGVRKRLEINVKLRKSSRLTKFDYIRNLSPASRCDTLTPISKAKQKLEHRKQQLEKWKMEKEKQKKEAAAKKRKPFLTGVPHNPVQYVAPPPPPPKVVPSTSGRVTRSQTARLRKDDNKSKPTQLQSFAPINAVFKAPQMKNLTKLPKLAPINTKKGKKTTSITFEPTLPTAQTEVKLNRFRTNMKTSLDTKVTRSTASNTRPTGKLMKPFSKVPPKYIQSSSSSGSEHSSQTLISSSLDDDLTALTPNKLIPKSESSSEERLRSPKSTENVPVTPEQIADIARKISPFVTCSRGKENARKEMKKKREEGLLDEDTCDMDSVDNFRRQLSSEIKRMTGMCETWDKIQEQVALPEAAQELVLAAVGQARLLMSKKLQQFSSLVERCAAGAAPAAPSPAAPSARVTPADLQGFWDMVFLQIENIEIRFKQLEELKARNWVDEAAEPRRCKVVKPAKAARPAAKPAAKAAGGGPSRLREMIAAARKAKKQESAPAAAAADNKTFEAGFFCVSTPARSPAPTPARSPAPTPARSPAPTSGTTHNLLKAVLSSEAKKASATKNSSSSFAMLRASLLSKNVECEGVEPLPQTPLSQVNLNATPGRSILKQTQDNTARKGRKSIKMVLFHQSGEDVDTSTKESEQMDKENSNRRLIRQDAIDKDDSPIMTRSRRKSMPTPKAEEKTPRRTQKTKLLEELEHNVVEPRQTPKRSTRSRKSAV